jgi:DNA-binding LytR/AlgR family response regulator
LEAAIKASGANARISMFKTAEDVLNHIHSGSKADLCFLEILLEGMSGIELAQKLRDEGFESAIAFVTVSNEYAAESYKVGALSYILKPFDASAAAGIINKIKQAGISSDNAGIALKTRTISRFLRFRDISYIEVIRHKIYFHLADGKVSAACQSLNSLLPRLDRDGRFARCHRSYVVNMDAVSAVNDKDAVMKCGGTVPVSKGYEESFCTAISLYRETS